MRSLVPRFFVHADKKRSEETLNLEICLIHLVFCNFWVLSQFCNHKIACLLCLLRDLNECMRMLGNCHKYSAFAESTKSFFSCLLFFCLQLESIIVIICTNFHLQPTWKSKARKKYPCDHFVVVDFVSGAYKFGFIAKLYFFIFSQVQVRRGLINYDHAAAHYDFFLVVVSISRLANTRRACNSCMCVYGKRIFFSDRYFLQWHTLVSHFLHKKFLYNNFLTSEGQCRITTAGVTGRKMRVCTWRAGKKNNSVKWIFIQQTENFDGVVLPTRKFFIWIWFSGIF